jgi:hypothetical protein
MYPTPTTMTNSTMATLTITIAALNPALSLIPTTSTQVTRTVMTSAGRSNQGCPRAGSNWIGALASR